MSKHNTIIKTEVIIQDLIQKKRFDLLFQIMTELHPEQRNNFLNEVLKYVLSDVKITSETFKKNIRKPEKKKTRRIELTAAEVGMVKQVSDEVKKLHRIMNKK